MVIGTYIAINTLNVNGLNAPTKRQRVGIEGTYPNIIKAAREK